MRKTLIYLFILTINIASCIKDDQCGPFANLYKLKNMEWYSGAVKISSTADSTYSETGRSDSIFYREYAIMAQPQLAHFYGYQQQHHFIPQAYACSPAEPKPTDTITDIKIYTNKDFNDKFKEGSDVTSLFDIYTDVYLKDQIYFNKRMDIGEYLNLKPLVSRQRTYFILKESPNGEIKRSFDIQIKFTGNDVESALFTTQETLILKD